MADRPGEETSSGERAGLAGFGLAAFAIVCCASVPLIAGGVAGGIAVGTVLGVGAGIAVAVAVVAAVVGRGDGDGVTAPTRPRSVRCEP